jgi:hypothetical protein
LASLDCTFWRTLLKIDNDHPAVQRAEEYWARVLEYLDALGGRRLTFATYVSLISPDTFGVFVWDETNHDGGKPFHFQIPYSPEWFSSSESIDATEAALTLPLTERRSFAAAIVRSDTTESATELSVRSLIADLLSDKDRHFSLMQRRFDGLLDRRGREQLSRYVSWNPLPPEWRLENEASEQLDNAIDLPGFRMLSGEAGFRARDLLPAKSAADQQ